MKKKVLFPILALVLALGLALPMAAAPAVASPDTIWTIGVIDGKADEFGTSFAGVNSTTYSVGDALSNFPARLHTSDYTTTPWVDQGVNEVTISFTTTADYVNVTLDYYRMGGETDEVWFDGTSLGTCTGTTDPQPSTLYTFYVPGVVAVDTHTIKIACTGRGVGPFAGTGDGSHIIDALELTGDEIGIKLSKTPPASAKEGDTITYTYEVENTGDVVLTAPSVTDMADSTSLPVNPVLDGHPYNIGDTNDDGNFDPGEKWVFTASYIVPWFTAGPVVNTATATAWYGDIKGTSTTYPIEVPIEHNPAIEVEKETDEVAYFNGTEVTYHYSVSIPSEGDCALGSVSLTDDTVSGLVRQPDMLGNDDNILDPSETWHYTADYTLECPEDNYEYSLHSNVATAVGVDAVGGEVTDCDCWTVIIFQWQPRTIGFWGNWDNHIDPPADMLELLERVNSQSTYFGPDDPGPYANGLIRTLLDPVKGKMDADKAEKLLAKQLLAAWLSVKSYEGATDTNRATYGDLNWAMDPDATVYIDTDDDGVPDTADGTVRQILDRIEGAIGSMDKDGLLLAKDILEDLNNAEHNNYEMFVNPDFDPEVCLCLYPVSGGSSNNVLTNEPGQGCVVLLANPEPEVAMSIQGAANGLAADTLHTVWVRDLTGYTGSYTHEVAGPGYTYYLLTTFTTNADGYGEFSYTIDASDLPAEDYEIQIAINDPPGDPSGSYGPTVLATVKYTDITIA